MTLICPFTCLAGNGAEILESLSYGNLNWTRCTVTAKGCGDPADTLLPAPRTDQPAAKARQQAGANLIKMLSDVRMDSQRDLSTVISKNDIVAARVSEMAQSAEIVDQMDLPDGQVEIHLQMNLRGGFLQLILPEEIVQVEPIKALNGGFGDRDVPAQRHPAVDANGFSGLIIDARGLNARAALVPHVVDEAGRQVYGPAYISREYAVQHGVCEYIRYSEDLLQMKRIAPKPLQIKALRAMGPNQCDIMISNADAFKLRDLSTNLHFLKQCRVVIVLD